MLCLHRHAAPISAISSLFAQTKSRIEWTHTMKISARGIGMVWLTACCTAASPGLQDLDHSCLSLSPLRSASHNKTCPLNLGGKTKIQIRLSWGEWHHKARHDIYIYICTLCIYSDRTIYHLHVQGALYSILTITPESPTLSITSPASSAVTAALRTWDNNIQVYVRVTSD